mgnify:CR=1 FL=1
MLDKETYDLMEAASVISKGLHRYETFVKDCQGCQPCTELWNEMKRADERQLEKIVSHLREHMAREQRPSRAA